MDDKKTRKVLFIKEFEAFLRKNRSYTAYKKQLKKNGVISCQKTIGRIASIEDDPRQWLISLNLIDWSIPPKPHRYFWNNLHHKWLQEFDSLKIVRK